ncbi:MAG: shufflon system plasmid conjugative transfer pilus tip adhesin PilV [Burkholderiaceae bacterium]|nr:shufflon system plasmid conjugative transfer pilus tip adhesin PilV [Burkholderiaceae bacterium]
MSFPPDTSRPRPQRGLILLEVVLALAVAATVIMGLIQLQDEQDRRSRATVAAQQALTVGQAMQSYINDQYATLLTQASATQPALITVPDLVTAGYLPAGTNARDTYGLTLCTLVVAMPGAVSSRLQGLMVAESDTAPLLSDVDLARVSNAIGSAGGAVYSQVGADAGTAVHGVNDGWNVLVSSAFSAANHRGLRCDGSSGAVALAQGRYMVALWHGRTFNNEDVLYSKAVPGRADLNTMKTALGLFVDNSGSATRAAYGNDCTQSGHVAADANGQMLTCRADSAGALRWGNTYFVDPSGTIRFGAACTMNGAYAADSSGLPLVCRGGLWGVYHYVDTAGSAGVAFGQPCGMTGASAADASGVPLACRNGIWTFGMPSSSSVVADGTCSVDGSMASDAASRPFSCQQGKWVAFNKPQQTQTKVFDTPGVHYWTVPAGVTEVMVTLAGGGESAGYSGPGPAQNKDGTRYEVEMFPGGSGGFFLDRPVTVVPGSRLTLTVGRGGAEQKKKVTAGNRGRTSSVVGTGVDLSCTGGGSDDPWAGIAGTCNVQPSTGIYGAWQKKEGSGLPGGQTPIGYGTGGTAERCWGEECEKDLGPTWGGNGLPGTGGVVMLRWKE